MSQDPEELLTPKEAAELVKMSEKTVRGWRIKGWLPVFKTGPRSPRYRRLDVLAAAAQSAAEGGRK